MLKRIEDVHRTVFRSVFVARNEASPNAAVIGVLACGVQEMTTSIETFDDLRADRCLFAQPDRGTQDENVSR
jgi:hypothetical protein